MIFPHGGVWALVQSVYLRPSLGYFSFHFFAHECFACLFCYNTFYIKTMKSKKTEIIMTYKLQMLLAVFVALIIGMNLLGTKIVPFLGLSVSVSLFMVPLTFLITDVVGEVYGRALARRFVVTSLIGLAVILGFVSLFVVLPPASRFPFDDAYRTIFGNSLRIIVASMIGFGLSQFHDVWAFEYWRKQTKGRFLWLRNNLSTAVSQAIDTFVFMFIAFYMVTPDYTVGFIIQLALPYYFLKIGFSVIDTPLVYLGVRWLKGGKK